MRGTYERTPEVREKLRLASLGHTLSLEAREKLKVWNLGRIRPIEFCNLMRERTLGQIHTEETKKKIRLALSREGNPNWLGGLSRFPYPISFDLALKEQIRARDGYKCRRCGVPQSECIRKLDVHHIDYDKTNLDWWNLISLCRNCNLLANFNRAFWREFLSQLLRSGV